MKIITKIKSIDKTIMYFLIIPLIIDFIILIFIMCTSKEIIKSNYTYIGFNEFQEIFSFPINLTVAILTIFGAVMGYRKFSKEDILSTVSSFYSNSKNSYPKDSNMNFVLTDELEKNMKKLGLLELFPNSNIKDNFSKLRIAIVICNAILDFSGESVKKTCIKSLTKNEPDLKSGQVI